MTTGLTLSPDSLGLRVSMETPKGTFLLREAAYECEVGGDVRRGRVEWTQARRSASGYELNAQLPGARLTLLVRGDGDLLIGGELSASEPGGLRLRRIRLVGEPLDLGPAPQDGYSFFMNGYQSWTASHSLRASEGERVPIWDPLIEMQDNLRNRPDGRKGYLRADLFAVLGNLDTKVFALIGQTAGFRQLVYVRAIFAKGPTAGPNLELVWDFDGRLMAPGERLPLDEVRLLFDTHANRVQERYFAAVQSPRAACELPAGWCSWYHYYTKVSAADMHANLEQAKAHQVDWNVFVLDDGYPAAIGDWLLPNYKFPQGVEAVATEMREKGYRPGIWLAPFIARKNSRMYAEHPDWFLKGEGGKPVVAGYNPLWGLGSIYCGIDTTHPGFQAYMRKVIHHFVREAGYRYLKLDFLYGAMLSGAAHDPCTSPAERLALGLDLIRQEAGEETVILGCGCPLSPAIGRVEAMRIGPDVAPFWDAKYRYTLTRDPHALCTKFALRSILNRAQMHRRFWVNDPDCMMLRAERTKLTAAERRMLVDAVAVTGGMPLLSDDLALFDDATWELAARAFELARLGDTGRPWPLDYMEHAFPRYVYNSAGLIAAFNFEDEERPRILPLARYFDGVLDWASLRFEDAWSGLPLEALAGVLDFGTLPPHGSRLLRIVKGLP